MDGFAVIEYFVKVAVDRFNFNIEGNVSCKHFITDLVENSLSYGILKRLRANFGKKLMYLIVLLVYF